MHYELQHFPNFIKHKPFFPQKILQEMYSRELWEMLFQVTPLDLKAKLFGCL